MFKIGDSLNNLTNINSAQKFPVSDELVISQLSIYPKLELVPNSTIFTIGSCFARNVEEALYDAGYDVPMLEFSVPESEWDANLRRNGILNRYTPQNIYQTVRWAHDAFFMPENYARNTEKFVIDVDDGVVDADLSGFIPVSESRFWQRRVEMLNTFEQLYRSNYVIITLGQTEAWYYENAKIFWSRLPATRVLRDKYKHTRYSIVDLEDAFRLIKNTAQMIFDFNSNAKIILSVSPVAADTFWQDGNALMSYWQTKLTLLHAAKKAVWEIPNVYYFPSFEAVHALQSPWEEDRMHVNDKTVREIVRQIL